MAQPNAYSVEIIDMNARYGVDATIVLNEMVRGLRENGAAEVRGAFSTDDDYTSFLVNFDAFSPERALEMVQKAEYDGFIPMQGYRVVRSERRIIG
jgi:hypothetical protein